MAADPDTGSGGGLGERLTAKVGPLPVWAWAAVLLAGGYLAYRLLAGSSSSSPPAAPATDSSATDSAAGDVSAGGTSTPVSAGDASYPDLTSGQGTPAGNLNDSLLSQLSGLQTSVDYLTAAVQTSPAFWPGSGDAGSGAYVPNGSVSPPPAKQPAPVKKPAAKPQPAHSAPARAGVRYYTYAPGKAPKGKAGQAAPTRGPAGTRLRFAKGKGYYYA